MSEQLQTQTKSELSDEGEINLLQLLRVIVRRRMVIAKICSFAVILSVCYSLTLKNNYTATSTILPPPREYGVGASASLAGGAGLLGAAQIAYMELCITVCKSRPVVDAVIKRLDLQKVFKAKDLEATRRRVRGAVKFNTGKDGTITVSAKNKNPQFAALLVNSYVEEIALRAAQLYSSKTGSERYFLEKRLRDIRNELAASEGNLKAFQEKNKSLRPDGQASAAVDGIARIRLEIINKEVQLATLRNSMTDESNEVKALQATIAKLKSQLAAMSGSGGSGNVIPAAGDVPARMSEYSRLIREAKALEAVFEQISKQYELSKINESRNSGTVQVIEEAIPPVIKSGPKRSRIVIVSAFAAFFISIVVVFVQEYLSKLTPEDDEIIREIKQTFRFWKRSEY